MYGFQITTKPENWVSVYESDLRPLVVCYGIGGVQSGFNLLTKRPFRMVCSESADELASRLTANGFTFTRHP